MPVIVHLALSSFILLLASTAYAVPLKNQLAKHASPYLAMHGSDPVAWQDWNAQVVKKAKQQNKLIYISSGYFSCHWCHVMQRESYKDPTIAKILNQYFIPVKVDRELNPALDARLIDFVERTQNYAGWPLNVFITPEGYPLVGMTYVPKENFKTILEKLSHQWKTQATQLKTIAKDTTQQLLAEQNTTQPGQLEANAKEVLTDKLIKNVNDIADDIQGGFGTQSKFPSVPQLTVLLNIQASKPQQGLKEFLLTTLDSMAALGLRDHVAGGFYRYTVDPNWEIPHFEKMLYNNALLASLYFKASRVFDRPDYLDIAKQTLLFMQKDMSSDIGVLAASLSAVDAKGVEGGCYLWQKTDLKKYLPAENYKVAKKYWKLVSNDKLQGRYHLLQVNSGNRLSAAEQKLMNETKSILYKQRNRHPCPIDLKPVAAWLGLALQAFITGYQETHQNDFKNTADKLFAFIHTQLWQKNRLYRSVTKNRRLGEAGLEDYALIAKAVFDYANSTHSAVASRFAQQLVQQAWQRFYKDNGWYLSEHPLIKYVTAQPVLADSPLPSPSAVLLDVTLQMKPDRKLTNQAYRVLQQGSSQLAEAPFWYASHIDVIRRHFR